MLKKFKELFAFAGVSFCASVLFGLFWIYIASFMTPEKYGNIGFLMSIATVGATIGLLGLNQTIIVYQSKGENIFPTTFIIILFSSLITSIVVFVLTQNLFVSLLLFGLALFLIMVAGLNSQERYRDFSKYRLIRAIFSVGLSILLYAIMGINGILLGYFIASLFVLKELYPFLKNGNINFKFLKSKLRFIIPNYGLNLSRIFINWGDKVLIGTIFGFSFLGNFHFAFQILMLFQSIPIALGTFLLPKESKGESNKKLKIYAIVFSCIFSIILIFLIPHIINNFFPKFHDAIIPSQILLISLIPFTINSVQTSEFLGKERTIILLITSLVHSGLYFIFIIIFGQEFGLIGMAYGFLIALVIRVVINFFISKTNLH